MEQSAYNNPKVVDLASRRPPVTYAVDVTKWWDGRMSVHIRDVADDDQSREVIADALREAADVIERRRTGT